MCKGEVTKLSACNGLLPLLGSGNICMVIRFPVGGVGDSILNCIHLVAGDYFLWCSIYFTPFRLKTGLVLLCDGTWAGVKQVRAEVDIDYLFMCFCNNCKRYCFLWLSDTWRTGVLWVLCPLFILGSRWHFTISTVGPTSGSLLCINKWSDLWHTWHLRISIMGSTYFLKTCFFIV